MKSVYERLILSVTVFDSEDTIITSGIIPEPTKILKREIDNRYGTFDSLNLKPPGGNWF